MLFTPIPNPNPIRNHGPVRTSAPSNCPPKSLPKKNKIYLRISLHFFAIFTSTASKCRILTNSDERSTRLCDVMYTWLTEAMRALTGLDPTLINYYTTISTSRCVSTIKPHRKQEPTITQCALVSYILQKQSTAHKRNHLTRWTL